MDIQNIYNNLNFLEDLIRLQYTNFIYKNFAKLEGKISFEEIISRLKKDEPIEYIFNLAEFCGLEFFVDKRVLIPRIETEEIVEKTLNFLQENSGEEFTIIDVGTGSGAIILSIAKKSKEIYNLQSTNFKGIDISADASEVAKINRKKLGLEGLVEFKVVGFQDFDFSKYKNLIILANLPYIPDSRKLQPSVEKYEPHLALFGGEKGDELILKLKSKVLKLPNLRILITEEDHGEIISILP